MGRSLRFSIDPRGGEGDTLRMRGDTPVTTNEHYALFAPFTLRKRSEGKGWLDRFLAENKIEASKHPRWKWREKKKTVLRPSCSCSSSDPGWSVYLPRLPESSSMTMSKVDGTVITQQNKTKKSSSSHSYSFDDLLRFLFCVFVFVCVCALQSSNLSLFFPFLSFPSLYFPFRLSALGRPPPGERRRSRTRSSSTWRSTDYRRGG